MPGYIFQVFPVSLMPGWLVPVEAVYVTPILSTTGGAGPGCTGEVVLTGQVIARCQLPCHSSTLFFVKTAAIRVEITTAPTRAEYISWPSKSIS